MSLRNLLPIGRAFRSTPGEGGRYRPAVRGLVPDFSRPGGNPPGVSGGAMWGGPEGGRSADGPGGVATASRGGRRGHRLPRWVEQLVLALLRPGNRRRDARAAAASPSLEGVRVVRNDLATADVEVVVVRPAGRARPLSPECRARLLAAWWAPMAAGLRRWRRDTR